MVVAQHFAAPGQSVLFECAGEMIFTQRAKIGRQPAG